MNRRALAILLLALLFTTTFAFRIWRHWRTTGSTGIRGLSGRPGSAEWFGGVLFAGSFLLYLGALAADFADRLPTLLTPRNAWLDALAVGSALLGIAGTMWAQAVMGASI